MTSPNVGPEKDATGGVTNGLLRFDTSGLPDDATITGATLSVWCATYSRTDALNVVFEYFDFASTNSDYAVNPTGTVAATVLHSSLGPVNANNQIPLTDFSGISKTGNTSFRVHLTGGTPTASNWYYFAALEHTTLAEAQLIVTYTTDLDDYAPENWINSVVAITADRLNHIEAGIDSVNAAVRALITSGNAHAVDVPLASGTAATGDMFPGGLRWGGTPIKSLVLHADTAPTGGPLTVEVRNAADNSVYDSVSLTAGNNDVTEVVDFTPASGTRLRFYCTAANAAAGVSLSLLPV